MDTFVESYDFTRKTVIPFCTSASSNIGSSANTLEKLAGTGNWINGRRFGKDETMNTIEKWLSELEHPTP